MIDEEKRARNKRYYEANKEKWRLQREKTGIDVIYERNRRSYQRLKQDPEFVEYTRAKAAAYYQANKEKCQKVNNRWKLANFEKVLWHRSKIRAAKMGMPFDIEIEDIVIPEFCPLLGLKLVDEDAPSLDRIDTLKGYVKGNVWVISARANDLKRTATIPEIRAMVSGYAAMLETLDAR